MELNELMERDNKKAVYDFLDAYVYGFMEDTKKLFNDGKSVDIPKLEETLIALDWLYGKGVKTPLSDEEYDGLHSIYIETTGKMISGDISATKKIKHDYPNLKGTVDKVHYILEKEKNKDKNRIKSYKSLEDWVRTTWAKLGRGEHMLGFWAKYDGLSIVLSLDENRKVTKAITRGNKDLGIGVDKTHIFGNYILKGIVPKEFDGKKVGLKTECIMTRDAFKEYNKKFGNGLLVDERSAITSLVNGDSFTSIHKKCITLKPLLMEVDGEFQSFEYENDFGPMYAVRVTDTYSLSEVLPDIIKQIKKNIDELDVKCDGIIVRWYNHDDMKKLGRNNDKGVNNFEIAYKFPKPSNYTKLIDIKQDIGLMGKVSFTAVFEPIKYKNKTITHASLGSLDRMKTLHLAKGDMVDIKYEIIPYLTMDDKCEENRSGNEPIKPIEVCPYCKSVLEMNPELSCTNPECSSRIMGKIYNFCIRMNISGVGENTIEELYHAGIVKRIEDLFDLEKKSKEILELNGFGEKTVKSLVKQFKKLESDEATILASVGIPSIGLKKSKKIIDKYYLSVLIEMPNDNQSIEELTKIEGIGYSIAEKLLEGVESNRKLIKYLLKHAKVISKKMGETKGIVCLTGFRNARFQKYLEELGYEVSDSMSKKVTLVIAQDPNGTSTKLKKARENSIPVMDVHEAYEKFGYNN